METIEEGFVSSLNRINFIFKNEIITTECIKSHNGFKLFGESFGPYEKGNKYKMKLFSAVPFMQNDILEIIQQEKCDNVDVQRYAISERDDQKLIHPSDNFFLSKVKEFKQFMVEDIKKKKKPQINLDRYNSYLLSIVDNRLLKLIKLAKTELSLDDERRLTISEKKLFDILFNIIKQWRNFFLSNSL
ncbi:MAG: hypothetical protein KGD58_01670 [Candidatus Lokiarchaeota archaeon]|nr:hypothetical protein [Candidatus Lokiarchaeota archaeon]